MFVENMPCRGSLNTQASEHILSLSTSLFLYYFDMAPSTMPPPSARPPPVMSPLDGETRRTEPATKDLLSKLSIFTLRRPARSSVEPAAPVQFQRGHSRSYSEPPTPPLTPAQLEIQSYLTHQQGQHSPQHTAPPADTDTVPLRSTTPSNSTMGRSSMFRGLRHYSSISILRRKKSKTGENMSPSSPGKSLPSTSPRSIIRRRRKSSKSLRRVPEPQYPVPPLPAQYRLQSIPHVSLHEVAGSRNTVVHDDQVSCLGGSAESDPSVNSLRPPPPTRRTPDTTPRAHAPPAEVALEFGTTPSPRSARVLDEACTPKQHRRTQSADVRPCSVFAPPAVTDPPRSQSYQTLNSFVFPAGVFPAPPDRGDDYEPCPPCPFPSSSRRSCTSFDSFKEMPQATPTKAMLTPSRVEAAEPECE